MMSFSAKVKTELLNNNNSSLDNIAILSAIIKNSYINNKFIRITTENQTLAEYVYLQLSNIYHITPKITVRKRFNFDKSTSFIIDINTQINIIVKDLGLDLDNIPLKYNDDIETKKMYLTGLFLISGSVNDPKTACYHLEFLIKNKNYGSNIADMLNFFNLNAKIIKRTNGYMIYLKEAEKIADFLRIIKAFNSLFYYEDIRTIRDKTNLINRLNNCEQANIEKTMNSSNAQIKDINLIKEHFGLDILDNKEKEVALIRLEHPEASLLELSTIISNYTDTKISKSGLNHRFRKIKAVADKIRNNS